MEVRGIDEVFNGMNNRNETNIKEEIGIGNDITKERKE